MGIFRASVGQSHVKNVKQPLRVVVPRWRRILPSTLDYPSPIPDRIRRLTGTPLSTPIRAHMTILQELVNESG